MSMFGRSNAMVVAVISATLLSACATPIRPDDLHSPKEVTCVQLTDAHVVSGLYGHWTIKLASGPYWSEKTDGKGTYYRAPPGGVSVVGANGGGAPGQPTTMDGGFYVPDNVNEPISLYRYFSIEVAPSYDASGLECSSIGYAREPATARISLVPFAAGAAAGGASGGLIGRSATTSSGMSYGQAAGLGAAGGLIGGVIVAAIINADVGKIVPVQPPVNDAQFLAKLRTLAATSKVKIDELRAEMAGDGVSRPGHIGGALSQAPTAERREAGLRESRLSRREIEALTHGKTWELGTTEAGGINRWEFAGSGVYGTWGRGSFRYTGEWRLNERDEVCIRWMTRQYDDACFSLKREGSNLLLIDSKAPDSIFASINVR
jgi:hypothetical protein